MPRRLAIAALLAPLLVVGCSGNDNVTEDEASEGWTTISEPLRTGQQALQKKAEEKGFQALLGGETVSHVEKCGASGDVKFKLGVDVGAGSGSGPQANLTAKFRECEDQDIITTGELDIDSPSEFGLEESGSGGGDGEQQQQQIEKLIYTGTLNYAGDVDGPCDVDLTVDTSGGSVSYEGTLCGYEASEILGFGF